MLPPLLDSPMLCPQCGHSTSHIEQRFCTQCGASLPVAEASAPVPEDDPFAIGAPQHVPPVIASKARDAADRTVQVLQEALNNPRFLEYVPGRSLTLLGVGLVVLALALSALPFFSGISPVGSVVMLVGSLLVAASELYTLRKPRPHEVRVATSQPLLQVLEHLPGVLRDPRIAEGFALLTCTYAILKLGDGLTSLLWVLAALALGYDQGKRLLALFQPAGQRALEAQQLAFRRRMEHWVAGGAAVCTLSLLFSWGRSTAWGRVVAGREQPLAEVTQFVLVVLGALPFFRKGLSTVSTIVPLLLAAWLSVWFLLMMSSAYVLGPWLFALGLLVIDTVVVVRFVRMSRGMGPGRSSNSRG